MEVDNPSAFPQNDAAVNRANNESGMSLRDYFAANVMPTLIRNLYEGGVYPHGWRDGLAVEAYTIADSMLSARLSPRRVHDSAATERNDH